MQLSAFRKVLFIIQGVPDTVPMRIPSVTWPIHYDVSWEEDMRGSTRRLLHTDFTVFETLSPVF